MSGLAGKTAIVTGGSRGIGAAIARRLAREGAQIVVHYGNNADAAQAVVDEITSLGGKAVAVGAEMSDLDAVRRLFTQTEERFGRLDILVNNAGIYEYLPLDQVTPEHFARQFDVNVRGLLFASQEAAKRLQAGGRIINISSGAATATPPTMGVYNATKAAVNALTQTWAIELGPRGITVNAVSPGVTETDGVRQAMSEAMQQAVIAQTPLGRIGTPEEVADVVAFVASDAARWVTGQIIAASGGLR